MAKKSAIERQLFHQKKKQRGNSDKQNKSSELPVVVFDNLNNFCASLVNTVTGQKIKIFDVTSNKLEYDIHSPIKSNIRLIKWCSIDGLVHQKLQQLVLCCDNGIVLIYSLSEGEVILKLAEAHNGAITDFVCLKNIGYSSSTDGKIARWDLGTGQLLNSWKAHGEIIHKLCVFDRLPYLISGGNSINIWSTKDCSLVQSLPGHINKVQSISSSSKLKVFLSSAHQDRFINICKFINSNTKDKFLTTPINLTVDDEVSQVSISNSSSIVAVTGKGNLAIWKTFYSNNDEKGKGTKQAESKKYPSTIIQFTTPSKVHIPVLQVACSNDGKSFTVARGDTWNLSFETLKFLESYKDKFTTYECIDPNTLLKDNKTMGSLSKISSQVTVKSGKSSKGISATVALTIGEKLKALEAELKLNQKSQAEDHLTINGSQGTDSDGKSIPSLEDSLSLVIQQALHTKDTVLLDKTLSNAQSRSIPLTISNIEEIYVPELFKYIVDQIITRQGATIRYLEWVRFILIQCSSYLVTIPWVANKLGELLEAIETRTQDFGILSRLSVRLSHIDSQIIRKEKANRLKRKNKSAPIYIEDGEVPINRTNGSEKRSINNSDIEIIEVEQVDG